MFRRAASPPDVTPTRAGGENEKGRFPSALEKRRKRPGWSESRPATVCVAQL